MLSTTIRRIGNQVERRRATLLASVRWSTCTTQFAMRNDSGRKNEKLTKAKVARRKIRLVIFDKDGTLLCFNAMWIPWLKEQTKRIEKATGIDMTHEMYRTLGVCINTHRALPGLLAEGTLSQIRDALSTMLQRYLQKITASDARKIIDDAIRMPVKVFDQQLQGKGANDQQNVIVPTADLVHLMQQLKQDSVRIAVCTSDCRENTLLNLKALGIASYPECIVCGDDQLMPPKPSAVLVQHICKQLQVDPDSTAVVGDTKADMLLGRNANVALKVAVLSGVGQVSDLRTLSDVIIPNVGHLYPLIAAEAETEAETAAQAKLDQGPYVTNVVGLGNSASSANTKTTVCTQKRGYAISTKPLSYKREGKTKEYDYVIVGAGSAGCVLAYRLSAANKTVCLLEAGPPNTNWKFHMPASALQVINSPKYNWNYETVAQKQLNNRKLRWPRGKTLGGSSSINGMVFMRGHPQDFDRWAFEENATGWSYADVLPYYKRMETYLASEDCPSAELAQYRGFQGPLRVTNGKFQNENHSKIALHRAFIDAARQAGHSYTHDINGYKQEGAGWFDCTIHGGKRMSTAVEYLRRSMWTKRVDVHTDVLCTRLLFDSNCSKVTGVEVTGTNERDHSAIQKIYAARDVIVAAGALNSPQLLLLSGIGDADSLKQLGLNPTLSLPGVGKNLQDHLEMYVQHVCQPRSQSLYSAQWHVNPLKMVNIGCLWFLRQKGWGATNHMESGAFIRSKPTFAHPNVQIHFLPGAFSDSSGRQTRQPGMQMHVGTLRPFSRGQLTLRSRNPFDPALIDPACLQDRRDVLELVDSVKIAREIFRQKAFDGCRKNEMSPGSHVQSDAEIEAFVREATESAYHPCGTCKMGDIKKDAMAVVDPLTMRVHGLAGVRVVDASVMPSETSGNLNAPTIMIAERASDIILGLKPAQPVHVPFWKA